jgi:hypothetical protein
LELKNRDNLPTTIEAVCSNELQWNLLFDTKISIKSHSKTIFPISVQIPENALANTETLVQVSLRLIKTKFPSSKVNERKKIKRKGGKEEKKLPELSLKKLLVLKMIRIAQYRHIHCFNNV